MRRRKRANIVVLSSEEKYCYAKPAFEPVLDHLSQLSSPEFYVVLESWREIVREGMEEMGATSSQVTADSNEEPNGVSDDSASETSSEITPADLIDTMKLIRQFEEEEDGKYAAAAAVATQPMFKQESTLHHDGSPTVGQTTTAQTLTQAWRQTVESPSAKPAPSKPVDLRTKAAVQPKAVKRSKQAARKHNQIDVLRFPQAKTRHNERKKRSKFAWKHPPRHKNSQPLYHVSELLASYPVIMDDEFMGARSAGCQRLYVCADNYDYNFVTPENLVTKLDVVVEAEKMKRKGSSYFGNDSDPIIRTVPQMRSSRSFLEEHQNSPASGAAYRMKAFYEIRRKCDAWLVDIDWVLSTKWENMLSTLELFDEETDTDGLLPSEAGEKHKEMAKDVAGILGEACLGSRFRLSGGEATVKVDHLVGMLAIADAE
ncbi:hypothetical protein PC116_g16037 [Phytophthora cactorum]|nr:hypothetical protein C6341_g13927 [Phytophthora cactorum]KAG4235836.1 hypothetical protein PC116_g16037 [Phytophthora cactorum]